jgi:hypothetical protein
MCSSLVAMECSLSMRLGSQRPMSGGGPQSSYNLGELTPISRSSGASSKLDVRKLKQQLNNQDITENSREI